jgi:hypothetical protein
MYFGPKFPVFASLRPANGVTVNRRDARTSTPNPAVEREGRYARAAVRLEISRLQDESGWNLRELRPAHAPCRRATSSLRHPRQVDAHALFRTLCDTVPSSHVAFLPTAACTETPQSFRSRRKRRRTAQGRGRDECG